MTPKGALTLKEIKACLGRANVLFAVWLHDRNEPTLVKLILSKESHVFQEELRVIEIVGLGKGKDPVIKVISLPGDRYTDHCYFIFRNFWYAHAHLLRLQQEKANVA